MLKYWKSPLLTTARHLTRSYCVNVGSNKKTSDAPGSFTEVNSILKGWDEKLKEAGVEDRKFNLKCIVSHVLQRKFVSTRKYNVILIDINNYFSHPHPHIWQNQVSDDFAHLVFSPKQLADFERYCEARCARMPLQHIIGEWDFMDITLKTAPTVFIPRPETEEFVRLVIKQCEELKPKTMLEIGCGSGAMSLSMLKALPDITATAIERSKEATKLAYENAKLLGLDKRFIVYNHTMVADQYMPEDLKDEKYDLIIGNPPYVKTDEFQYLHPEVVM